jgi:hypothetical protein
MSSENRVLMHARNEPGPAMRIFNRFLGRDEVVHPRTIWLVLGKGDPNYTESRQVRL